MNFMLHVMVVPFDIRFVEMAPPMTCDFMPVATFKFLLPTAKTNARDTFPMFQDKFGYLDWNHLLLHCSSPWGDSNVLVYYT